MRDFSINADAEAARVVTGSLTRRFLDRKHVGGGANADYTTAFSECWRSF
jgi:hypothetical protein